MTVRRVLLGFLLVIVGLFAYKYTRTNAEQRGYRGLAMFQLKRPFQVDAQKAIHATIYAHCQAELIGKID